MAEPDLLQLDDLEDLASQGPGFGARAGAGEGGRKDDLDDLTSATCWEVSPLDRPARKAPEAVLMFYQESTKFSEGLI